MSDCPAHPPAPARRRRRPRLAAALLLAAAAAVAGCGGDGSDGSRDGALPGPETRAAADPGPGRAAEEPPRSGARLARDLGCGACHDGVGGDPGRRAPPLPGRAADPAWAFAYLADPAAYARGTGAGRMPGFHLDEAERLALALFLASGVRAAGGTGPNAGGTGPSAGAGREGGAERRARAFREAREAHPDVDARRGRMIFLALNCAGCHPHPEAEPWRAGPDLGREGERVRPAWLRRWLRSPTALRPFGHPPGTGSRMPDFRLTAAEADSLAAFLTRGAGSPAAEPSAGTPDVTEAPAREPSLATAPAPDSVSPYRRWKARTLLAERLSCLGCHRVGGDGGRIGPALDGVAARRPRQWIAAMVRAPGEAVPGTVMPAPVLPDETRRLLVDYLATPGEASPAPPAAGAPGPAGRPGGEGARVEDGYLSLVDHPILPPPGPPGGRAAGRASPGAGADAAGEDPAAAAYARLCATCHGSEGRADGYNARYLPVAPTPHASAEHMSTRPSATLFDGVHAGGRILGRSPRMPAFGGSLSADEIWDLVAHLRRLCDCTGPAWSRDNAEVPGRVRAAGAGGSAR